MHKILAKSMLVCVAYRSYRAAEERIQIEKLQTRGVIISSTNSRARFYAKFDCISRSQEGLLGIYNERAEIIWRISITRRKVANQHIYIE